MLSRTDKNYRASDGDGVYTRMKIRETTYEKITFLIVSLNWKNLSIKDKVRCVMY